MPKMYTKSKILDPYGKEITVYRSLDAKLSVELVHELTGGYWWTKVKSIYGPGNDQALNLTDDSCMALVAILKDIDKRNRKLNV